MTFRRGEVWMADLNPIRGSEQAGRRPVIVVQNDALSRHTTTALCVPLTTNQRRAVLPSSLSIAKGEGSLPSDSVALAHQLRVLDKSRLTRKLGRITPGTLRLLEDRILFSLAI